MYMGARGGEGKVLRSWVRLKHVHSHVLYIYSATARQVNRT
jgi:hypothetical protein